MFFLSILQLAIKISQGEFINKYELTCLTIPSTNQNWCHACSFFQIQAEGAHLSSEAEPYLVWKQSYHIVLYYIATYLFYDLLKILIKHDAISYVAFFALLNTYEFVVNGTYITRERWVNVTAHCFMQLVVSTYFTVLPGLVFEVRQIINWFNFFIAYWCISALFSLWCKARRIRCIDIAMNMAMLPFRCLIGCWRCNCSKVGPHMVLRDCCDGGSDDVMVSTLKLLKNGEVGILRWVKCFKAVFICFSFA